MGTWWTGRPGRAERHNAADDLNFHMPIAKASGSPVDMPLMGVLSEILEETWMEAVLIMDADVVYEPDSLRKMTRHFADPEVGAVTAYIKEGSRPKNWMNRFIAYEYITAQAAARRSQNVLGALACLAGGAQLHTRANLEAIGGQIDTTSLAEDTFTT